MHLIRDNPPANQHIQSVGSKQIKINHKIYTTSIMLSQHADPMVWPIEHISQLTDKDIEFILSLEPSLLLLGTGETLIFPDKKILSPLYQHAIGLEIMNTPSACKTFNILAYEHRKVVAVLINA